MVTVVQVCIDIVINHNEGIVLEDVINDLDYDISSNEEQIQIIDTNMSGFELIHSNDKNIKVLQ